MTKKNIFLYAGAAIGVTVCGVFLSKELREMLFDSLSSPRKKKRSKGDEKDKVQDGSDKDNTKDEG